MAHRVVGVLLACVVTKASAQAQAQHDIDLSTAARDAVRSGSFTEDGDAVTFTVNAPVDSTLDFVVELGQGLVSTSSASDLGLEMPDCHNCNDGRAVWPTASIEAAAGQAALTALSCRSNYGNGHMQSSGAIQLTGIKETAWTFRVTYARPAFWTPYNGACNGNCGDTNFLISEQDDATGEATAQQRTCPDLIASYVPGPNGSPAPPCADIPAEQPWRVSIMATSKPAVEAVGALDLGGDGASISWKADPAWTDKEWHYISSDLNDWPRAEGASEALQATFAFGGKNAGMMVMVDYGKPPTETRVIGHSQPSGSGGYYFSTALYSDSAPPAPAACVDSYCDTSNSVDIWIQQRDNEFRGVDWNTCEPTGAHVGAFTPVPAADTTKVFIAMQIVAGSSMPATPMVKMEYGTYCNASSGDLCTYHWVSLVFQIIAVMGVGVGFFIMKGKQKFAVEVDAPWVGDCAHRYLIIVLWAHLVVTICICLVPLFGWLGFPVIALWGTVYYPGAIMHNRCRIIVYTIFQVLGLGWWLFALIFAFALAWGGFHVGFAAILFFAAGLNWLTCAAGVVAGLIVLGCSKLQVVEMEMGTD